MRLPVVAVVEVVGQAQLEGAAVIVDVGGADEPAQDLGLRRLVELLQDARLAGGSPMPRGRSTSRRRGNPGAPATRFAATSHPGGAGEAPPR